MEFFSFLHSIWTVLVLLVFLGIVGWAYSSKNKSTFDEVARSVLDDDDSVNTKKDTHNV